MQKDIDGDYDNDQNAPFLDLPNGLDPTINYKQKFVYPSPQNMPKMPPKANK